MQERNALFKELMGLGLYVGAAESEVKINPTDERIDVRAKFSLQRMMKQGGDAAIDAEGMVNAINTGQLAGIYGDDLRRSAEIAKQLGTQRWLLVPKGKDAELVSPPAESPSIVFRDGVEKDKNRFDLTLRSAWKSFGSVRPRPPYIIPIAASSCCEEINIKSSIDKVYKAKPVKFCLLNFDVSLGNTNEKASLIKKFVPGCKELKFRAGDGFRIEPKMSFCPDRNDMKNHPWLIGFIQTVKTATYSGSYSDNKSQKKYVKFSVKDPTRDALKKNTEAPWYDDPGNTFGPWDLVEFSPLFADQPNVLFTIEHPDDKSFQLRSVCMYGKFATWLILRNKNTKEINYFYHWEFEINYRFACSDEIVKEMTPCSQSSWIQHSGTIKLLKQGKGKGSDEPKLDLPVAREARIKETNLSADPCEELPKLIGVIPGGFF